MSTCHIVVISLRSRREEREELLMKSFFDCNINKKTIVKNRFDERSKGDEVGNILRKKQKIEKFSKQKKKKNKRKLTWIVFLQISPESD